MIVCPNMEDAISLSYQHKGETIWFPCGAITFVDALPDCVNVND